MPILNNTRLTSTKTTTTVQCSFLLLNTIYSIDSSSSISILNSSSSLDRHLLISIYLVVVSSRDDDITLMYDWDGRTSSAGGCTDHSSRFFVRGISAKLDQLCLPGLAWSPANNHGILQG
jgi:hypothetical protein